MLVSVCKVEPSGGKTGGGVVVIPELRERRVSLFFLFTFWFFIFFFLFVQRYG